MVDFKRLSDRARDLAEKRGGTEGLKQDAERLKNIAAGEGTVKDKAKRAADALKEPKGQNAGEGAGAGSGARETSQPAPGAQREAGTGPERPATRKEGAGSPGEKGGGT